jgi:hypothetical protein
MAFLRASALAATLTASLSTGIFNQAARAQEPSSAAPASGMTLKGGLEHAETLPEVDDTLKVGAVYSDDLLPKPDAKMSKQWYLIPAWFAGTRHCDEATILSRFNYVTGESTRPMFNQLNRQDSTSGYQKDKEGNIWDFKHVPQIQHVESNFENAVLYVRKVTPLFGSADRLVVKYEELSIGLNKRTNKIIKVIQQEQINTTTCTTPGNLRIDVSVKSFDQDGKPSLQEESVILAQVTAPFEQKDTFEGDDLKADFRNYLVANHLEKLIPD